MDAMEFFQLSAGKWKSQRTTHHLPFRRAEMGDSDIYVEALAKEHPKVKDICQLHDIDPQLAVGGAFVSWDGSMAWDKDNENHEGTTVFALVPDGEDRRKGRLLRDKGYAEIVPVVGHYEMDDEDGLILTTEYETMTIFERFWFASPNLRLRSSTVKRFGGFNTATFCAESRVKSEDATDEENEENAPAVATKAKPRQLYSISGW
jgi:hypothetical protein